MIALSFCAIGIIGGLIMWGRFHRERAAGAFAAFALFWGVTEPSWPIPPGYFLPTLLVIGAAFVLLLIFTKPDQKEEEK